jgi:ABC transporter DrrB family efflux protein
VTAGSPVPAHPSVWRDSTLIAGRQLRALRLNPSRMIYPLVQPVVLLVLFVSVLGNLAVSRLPGAGPYREFLIPGIFLQNAVLTAPTSGLGLLRDAAGGVADRFRSLPMSRSAVLVGRLASDAIIFVVQAGLLLAIATLLGFWVRTGVPGMMGIIAVTVGVGVAFATASCWLALLIADPEAAERVLFFPAIALAFLSSAFAPVSDLATWMQPIARASPVTAAVGVVRALATGGPALGPLVELCCWIAALTIVPGALAVLRWQSSR